MCSSFLMELSRYIRYLNFYFLLLLDLHRCVEKSFLYDTSTLQFKLLKIEAVGLCFSEVHEGWAGVLCTLGSE